MIKNTKINSKHIFKKKFPLFLKIEMLLIDNYVLLVYN